MQKTIKAAVAAFSGGVLLLGGAGTLAYWTDVEDVGGGDLVSGELTLGAFSCSGWTLVDTGGPFVLDEDPLTTDDQIVPGEAITRDCTSVVQAEGQHLQATLSAEAPSDGAGALAEELSYAVSWTVDGDAGRTAITTADDGLDVVATVTVTFPFDLGGVGVADNDANGNVTATLDAISFTLTQTDD